jgi:hypothetical protein
VIEFLQSFFLQLDTFHPDWRILGTITMFLSIMIITLGISFIYARRRFMNQLKVGVDTEVQRITEHLEQRLDITLTDRPDENNGNR